VGGTEMHTCALSRALVAGGYEVTVCVYFEFDPGMVEAVEGTGAAVRLLRLVRSGRRWDLPAMWRLARAFAAAVKEVHPYYVHVQYMAPGVAPLLAARLGGVPRVLATIHVPASEYGWRRWWPRTLANRLCDAFLCVSRCVEASFFGDSTLFEPALLREGKKHFTIWNCVDLEEIDRVRARVQEADRREALGLTGCTVIGMAARLIPEKGTHHLLQALAELAGRMPEVRLLLIGDGPQRESLSRQAVELGIADRIVWTGRLLRAATLEHLALTDVIAVPSQWEEGFGLTAIEAMALGKPVVASNTGGLREVVTDGRDGLLIPVGDPAALARALAAILNDGAMRRRMGLAARETVEARFSLARFSERHRQLYDGLADSASRGYRGQPMAIDSQG
jgi:glycosyltransferase involved in cell wall biosynthesis